MSDELTVALGQRFFTVRSPWGRVPEHLELSMVSGIAADSEQNVYIFQRVDPPIICLNRDGDYLNSWGRDLFADPHGIFISPTDEIVAVDRNGHQVLVFDKDGVLRQSLGEPGRPQLERPFNHPTGAAIAPNGDIFVADGYGNASIHHFSPEGELIRSWGSLGRGPGEFHTPHAIWIEESQLLVVDRENDRIQVFTYDGQYIAEWTMFYKPMDICVDASRSIYVTDQVPSVTKLSMEGRVEGRCSPVETYAHSIWCDKAESIYLAEVDIGRVSKLIPLELAAPA